MIDAREKLESTFGNYYCARHSNAAISKAGGESFRYVESFSTLQQFEATNFSPSSRVWNKWFCHRLVQTAADLYESSFESSSLRCPLWRVYRVSLYEIDIRNPPLVRITEERESTRVIIRLHVRIEFNCSLIWQRSKYWKFRSALGV